MPILRVVAAVLLFSGLAACQVGPPADPPAGWESDGDGRWWQPGVDTSLAFRDLTGFETMGLSDRDDGLRPEGPVVRNVQRRFLPLYRNHPELVDSVFVSVAIPIIEREATPGDETAEREALVSELRRAIWNRFQEPQARPHDAPTVPDSLQRAGIAGTITLQIYLNDEGRPVALSRLDGVHPTLDAIVMRNYAERSWRPAYLGPEPVYSWVRQSITIRDPAGQD